MSTWDGSTLRIVGCVVRNYDDGLGWRLIGGNHFAKDIQGVHNNNDYVTIEHPGSLGVITTAVTPDNSLSEAGITVGLSGGGEISRIYMHKDGVRLNPNDVNTTTYPGSNIWFLSIQPMLT